ncbi:hypothetical protein ACTXT7_006271 [Hymenolepis weldensis]
MEQQNSFKPTTESSPTPKVAAFPITDWPEAVAATNNGFKTSIFTENNGHGNVSFSLASADATSSPTNPLLGVANPTVSTTSGSVPVSSTIDVSSSNSAMALFGAEIKSPTSMSSIGSLTGKRSIMTEKGIRVELSAVTHAGDVYAVWSD